MDLLKFPRTQHIEGSRLGEGDEDLDQVPVTALAGKHLVIEEKVDGANAGISFDEDANLCLQCRGHYLTGGPRERQFGPFKQWASTWQDSLFDALSARYLLFGEWMYAKHTVYYDLLPHYFLAYDVWDRERRVFLSTPAQIAICKGLPIVRVPILFEGEVRSVGELRALVAPSRYKSPDWKRSLLATVVRQAMDPAEVEKQTDPSDLAEGIYLKVEEGSETVGRYKWVRQSFVSRLVDSGSHWADRPLLPNRLAPGVDLYADTR
jgi:hypothetical protein